MNVTFFTVTTTAHKKECISAIAREYALKGKNLQFIVEDDNVAKFVDQLLWSFPAESFLPHTLKKVPSIEKIAIFTKNDPKWPKAETTFNLLSAPLENESGDVLELLDKTDAAKEAASQSKLQHYKNAGIEVRHVSWSSIT
ncbi:MAG: DNA polymerase III subunit chi [Parachlamydiales bacterium]|jgi:DNA polymerase-3 subunit chi